MEDWIRDNFEVIYIEEDDAEVFVIDERMSAYLNVFLNIFSDCGPHYNKLVIRNDEKKAGWKSIFNDWKEQGLLN